MIVATMPDGRWRFVTQSDHAHLAAEILSLWHTDGLPAHPRRDDLLFAAREHDNGWREHDAAPRVRADGRPHDFRSLSGADRRAIWTRGTARHPAARPYAALLILEHARTLHAGARDDPAWQDLLAAWDAQRAELLEQTFTPAATLEADYAWIERTDALALALAERWEGESNARGLRIAPRLAETEAGADALALDPFPLRGSTTFMLPFRTLAARPFGRDRELAAALAEARWQEARVRLLPLADDAA